MAAGVVGAVYVAADAGEAPVAVERVRAVPGRGLEGDRYFLGCGSFSRWPATGRAVTLIEQEAIDSVRREHALDLGDGRSRRNVVTAGVDLAGLVGRTVRVGTALLRGERKAEPCGYLERRVGLGLVEALKGRGGLRAEVLEEGYIGPGDRIQVVGDGGA
jgi:MOSC domain-containing protein YiiM